MKKEQPEKLWNSFYFILMGINQNDCLTSVFLLNVLIRKIKIVSIYPMFTSVQVYIGSNQGFFYEESTWRSVVMTIFPAQNA